MLSCSWQVDSVLLTVTTSLGEAAIYIERDRKPESKKCFLLRTRLEWLSRFLSVIQSCKISTLCKSNNFFAVNQSDRPLCRILVRVLLFNRKEKFKKGKQAQWLEVCYFFGLNQLCVKHSRRGSHKQTWNLSKILHRRIFRLKILHRQFDLILTLLVRKNTKNE